jgi:hypothetical protein
MVTCSELPYKKLMPISTILHGLLTPDQSEWQHGRVRDEEAMQ